MELYVGPLSSSTTVKELQRFFKGFHKKADFQIKKLVRSTGPHYFGIVDIESERLANKAIKKLHAQKFAQHRVIVREFEHRASSNDRRAINWRNIEWQNIERRSDERRQKFRVGKQTDIEFDGYDGMAVKHI